MEGVGRLSWRRIFLLLSWTVGCATPSVLTGTPMKNTSCSQLPTIEECQSAAAVIDNACVRQCVAAQCAGAQIDCGEYIQKKCQQLNEQRGARVGGFVVRSGQTCQKPKFEIGWCELPMSRECRAKALVHELAHACGWSHGEGGNVPGEQGKLQCK